MKQLLTILGSTSAGKTDLALNLAKKFNGELVACDSRQVYQGLDIGTGKMPGRIPNSKFQISNFQKQDGYWKINGIRIWMYDVASLKQQYSVADYVLGANKVIDEILTRGKLPIIVGGTGLYLKALLEGLPNLSVPLDLKLRKKLESLSLEELQQKLKEISPQRWGKMNNSDRQNPRRLTRAIEVEDCSPRSMRVEAGHVASLLAMTKEKPKGLSTDVLKIGLTAPKEILYRRINERVMEWVKNGIAEEVKKLINEGVTKERIINLGLEYKVVLEYLDKDSNEEMIEKMQNKVRQYAKRQITWFKKEKNVVWFDITEKNYLTKMVNLVAKWYDKPK